MKPTVVFLHGLARTHRSLGKLRRRVEGAGYPTWARTYPSRRLGLEELAVTVAGWIREELGDREVFAVTHSLGGIVLRHMSDLLPWRGAVMMAPPNTGSRVATVLRDNALFRWFFGPAAQEVPDPGSWPPPPSPFGIIAGTRGSSVTSPPSWITASLSVFPPAQPNDGVVAVSETRLDGMSDFATLPANHTWIMNHPDVHRMVIDFLREGSFGTARAAAEE